ncbi:MAG: hypothetical protein ACI8Z9_001409, partial [Paraglaciecola sp.]
SPGAEAQAPPWFELCQALACVQLLAGQGVFMANLTYKGVVFARCHTLRVWTY